MPRSLKVVIECDACNQEIEEGEDHAGALTLTINGVGPKQIDLCPVCLKGDDYDEFNLLDLLRLFEQADAIPTPHTATRQRTRESVQCPACDATSPTAQGLGRHTRSAHGMSVADLRVHVARIEES